MSCYSAEMIISGIYCITNSISGRVYVGSARDTKQRWGAHRYKLARGTHHSPAFQRSWNKHGAAAFTFEILEIVEDRSLLFEREQCWMDMLKSWCPRTGFNVSPTAGSPRGVKRSKELRERMSVARKGRKMRPAAAANIAASNRVRNVSVEMRSAVKLSKMALYQDPARREQLRQQALVQWSAKRASGQPLGMPHTPETKAKLSIAKAGKMSAAHKAAIAASNRARSKVVRGALKNKSELAPAQQKQQDEQQ